MCDGEEGVPDSLNLLRIPQISTPERESFKAYRERQRERKHNDAAPPPTEAELMRAEMERVPLGMEPVMGEPRDLREPEWQPPTSDEIATAEEEFGQMLGGPAQRYKATLEKVDDLGIGDGIDKLLSP